MPCRSTPCLIPLLKHRCQFPLGDTEAVRSDPVREPCDGIVPEGTPPLAARRESKDIPFMPSLSGPAPPPREKLSAADFVVGEPDRRPVDSRFDTVFHADPQIHDY
jgi:hypothetical protein